MQPRKFKLALFIFRRDLRLYDNTSLINACQQSQVVLPCFIFDPNQSKQNNQHFSHNCFQFMIQSLDDLNKQISTKGSQLYFFSGIPFKIVSKLIQDLKIEAIFLNRDYTNFSKNRDTLIRNEAKRLNVPTFEEDDLLLVPRKELPEGISYKKFTPFYNKIQQIKVRQPNDFNNFVFYNKSVPFESAVPDYNFNEHVPIKGGRKQGLKLLAHLPKHYQLNRNDISSNNSNLSAHNKFGTISIREFYHTSKEVEMRRSLYWRDFYYYSMSMHGSFQCLIPKYNKIDWTGEQQHLELWKKGQTGVPIVDAAMRQLKFTGMIHNRLRMIVACFLVKDLLLPWQQGQKHFAHYLVDYDPSQNNGNWQWVASTGYDSQPYFRIFNPKTQSSKFDPKCQYIKKWIPELAKVDNKDVHDWEESYKKWKVDYCKPIVIHKNQKSKCLELYSVDTEASEKKQHNAYNKVAIQHEHLGDEVPEESEEEEKRPKKTKVKPLRKS